MKLPNGYGSITKLTGVRRNPWMVRITTGWTDEGKEIRKVLGYYSSRTAALSSLAQYHEHPYDVDTHATTFDDMWKKWTALTYTDKGEQIPHNYAAAYKWLPNLHEMTFADIRRRHIQGDIDACPLGYPTKRMMKTLCNKLFKLAMDYEVVSVNYATDVELPEKGLSRKHHPFEPEELAILWRHTDDFGAMTALVLSYTGFRPTELMKVKTADVYLDKHYMMGGMKTAAGKNRIVPIADKIAPIIASWYDEKNEYLVMSPRDGKPILTYDRLRYIWERSDALKLLGKPHLPHDGRHTCATMLDNAGVNLKVSQLILGHSAKNITTRVYTHKTIAQLIEAINRI